MSSTMSSIRSSPIPDLAYDSYRSLTLRDQTLIRRQLANAAGEGNIPQQDSQKSIPKNLQMNPLLESSTQSSNLRSRSVVPLSNKMINSSSTNTTTTTIRRRPSRCFVTGGKAYDLDGYNGETLTFWILLGILIILVIGNSILTFLVLGVVRVGAGMESIEFLPHLLKFYGNVDLGEVYKRDGILQSFDSQPMEISGDDGGEVLLQSHEGSQPTLSVERGAINISQVQEFRVVDKKGREVFSTNTPTLGLPRGVQKLDVRVAKVNRITSNSTLQLVSTTFTYLKGSEGTHFEGKQITFKADQDILLKSVNGNIVLTGKEGIYLNVHDLPLVRESGVTRKSYTYTTHGKKEPQYQLCICMPTGKLFRVEIPLNNLSRSKKVGCHTPNNPPC